MPSGEQSSLGLLDEFPPYDDIFDHYCHAWNRLIDQPWHIGHDELRRLVQAHDTERRFERGEGIVRDLGLGRGHHRDQRRLSDVRKPDEGDVGQQLELEVQPTLVARLALLGERRRAAAVAEEPSVASAATSAFGGEVAVTFVDQVGDHHTVGVLHHRALGDGHDEILTGSAVLALALPMRAAGGPAMRVVAEPEQRRHVAVGDEPDVAAVPAVAPVGSAFGNMSLAAERDGARTTITGLHMQATLVDEPGHPVRLRGGAPNAGVTSPDGQGRRRYWPTTSWCHSLGPHRDRNTSSGS